MAKCEKCDPSLQKGSTDLCPTHREELADEHVLFCTECGSRNYIEIHRSPLEPAHDYFQCLDCLTIFRRKD